MRHEEIGRGQKGVVYSVCCNANCNYIVKVVEFNKHNDKSNFLNEVNMQQQFYNSGFAPRIIVACYCKHEGVIVMEKVQLLGDYLDSKPSNERKEIWEKLMVEYVKKYKEMLTEKGLYQGDTNPGNIAISLDGTKPLMIDFGLSTVGKKIDEQQDVYVFSDLMNEFKMSLKMILDGKKGTVVEPKTLKMRSRVHNPNRNSSKRLFYESSDDDEDKKPLALSFDESSDDDEDKKPLALSFDESSDDDEDKKPLARKSTQVRRGLF